MHTKTRRLTNFLSKFLKVHFHNNHPQQYSEISNLSVVVSHNFRPIPQNSQLKNQNEQFR